MSDDYSERTAEVPTDRRNATGPQVGRIKTVLKSAAKKLVPESTAREIRTYLAYPRSERRLYLKVRVSNGLRLTIPKRTFAPANARSFLFVCFGNIMRSPMCEALMNRALENLSDVPISVTSAGLNATPGKKAHPWAIRAAREMGVSLEQHRACLVTLEGVERADVIFAMDYQNHVQLLSRFPQAEKKVFMLSDYAGKYYSGIEIADPFYLGKEGTRSCYKILDDCIRNLAGAVLKKDLEVRGK